MCPWGHKVRIICWYCQWGVIEKSYGLFSCWGEILIALPRSCHEENKGKAEIKRMKRGWDERMHFQALVGDWLKIDKPLASKARETKVKRVEADLKTHKDEVVIKLDSR